MTWDLHAACMLQSVFLLMYIHDCRKGGLYSYDYNLWCYACGSCPRIFRILCSLTQPGTGILSNLVGVGLLLFNPMWYGLVVTSLHRYQWGCRQPRKHYKQMETLSTSRQSLQGKRLEVANIMYRNQWNGTQMTYTILRGILRFFFRGEKLLFIISNHLLR